MPTPTLCIEVFLLQIHRHPHHRRGGRSRSNDGTGERGQFGKGDVACVVIAALQPLQRVRDFVFRDFTDFFVGQMLE